MTLDVVSFLDLQQSKRNTISQLKHALFSKGIVGVKDVPHFVKYSQAFVKSARQFSKLSEAIKAKYTPNRAAGITEGHELGAEKFKNKNNEWQIDDKKASYYAFVPDRPRNVWPAEVDLKTPYLALGELIFDTGKLVLNAIGLNESKRLQHSELIGYGRMLHYHKINNDHSNNDEWCGAHFDHGIFTGLMPAYYFNQDDETVEPENAGLFIQPTNATEFQKIDASKKDILLFQVGEFGQLISNDDIRATKHFVKSNKNGIDRYTFALFYSAPDEYIVHSKSVLTQDTRYHDNQFKDGSINYDKWQRASLERYYAK